MEFQFKNILNLNIDVVPIKDELFLYLEQDNLSKLFDKIFTFNLLNEINNKNNTLSQLLIMKKILLSMRMMPIELYYKLDEDNSILYISYTNPDLNTATCADMFNREISDSGAIQSDCFKYDIIKSINFIKKSVDSNTTLKSIAENKELTARIQFDLNEILIQLMVKIRNDERFNKLLQTYQFEIDDIITNETGKSNVFQKIIELLQTKITKDIYTGKDEAGVDLKVIKLRLITYYKEIHQYHLNELVKTDMYHQLNITQRLFVQNLYNPNYSIDFVL